MKFDLCSFKSQLRKTGVWEMWKHIQIYFVVFWQSSVFLHLCAGVHEDLCSQWTGGRYFDGFCYYVSLTPLNYTNAQVNCRQMNKKNPMQLAEPRTEQQYGFLKDMVKNLNLSSKSVTGVLLGGSRDGDSKTFRWSDGSEVTSWWAPSRPDDVQFMEDCIEMRFGYDLALNDIPCGRVYYYACQIYTADPCESVLTGSEYFDGNCFKIYNQVTSWNTSVTTCENDGGFLAEPRNLPAIQFLLLLIKITPSQSTGDSYFLGASDDKSEGTFRWLTTGETMNLTFWGASEPSNSDNSLPENYLTIKGSTMKLNDASSDSKAKFVCEKKVMKHEYIVVIPSKLLLQRAQLFITSTDVYSSIYMVSQLVVSTDTCGAYEKVTTEVIAVLEPRKYIDLDARLGMNSAGIFGQHMRVSSSQELTVVLSITQDSPNSFYLTGTLILNVALLTQNYFLLSFPYSHGQLTVTALNDGTDIILKVPLSFRPDVVLGVAGVSLRQPGYATLTLNEYHTAVINTDNLRSGFIYATKAIAVYSFIEVVSQEEETMSYHVTDMLIPAELMSSEYVTFPSWPLSDTVGKYHILAIHDNTNVVIYGPQTQSVTLSKSGDVQEITLPGPMFGYMKSDNPFQVRKSFHGTTKGACVSTLLPSTLWRTEYVFITPSVNMSSTLMLLKNTWTISSVLFLISHAQQFAINDQAQVSCLKIEGTDLSGCYFEVPLGMLEPVYITNNGSRFAAYAVWVKDNDRTLTCYPLDVDTSNKFWQRFDGPSNINFNETACDGADSTTITNPTSTVTYTTSTIPSDTSTTSWSRHISTTPWSRHIPAPSSSSDYPIIFEVDYKALLEKIQIDLEMNFKNTSTYRRSKTSVADMRVSATVVGVVGVIIMMVFAALFILADILSVIRFLLLICLRGNWMIRKPNINSDYDLND